MFKKNCIWIFLFKILKLVIDIGWIHYEIVPSYTIKKTGYFIYTFTLKLLPCAYITGDIFQRGDKVVLQMSLFSTFAWSSWQIAAEWRAEPCEVGSSRGFHEYTRRAIPRSAALCVQERGHAATVQEPRGQCTERGHSCGTPHTGL